MIDYEGSTEVCSAFPETVPVSVSEYRLLVEKAERGRILSEGIMRALNYTGDKPFSVEATLDDFVVIWLFRAVCPEDYDLWLEEQKKRTEEERKKVAAENDIL